MPEFRCDVGFVDGARNDAGHEEARKLAPLDDTDYSALVQRALDLGFEKLTA